MLVVLTYCVQTLVAKMNTQCATIPCMKSKCTTTPQILWYDSYDHVVGVRIQRLNQLFVIIVKALKDEILTKNMTYVKKYGNARKGGKGAFHPSSPEAIRWFVAFLVHNFCCKR